MSARNFIGRLARDVKAGSVIEFGLLAPVMMALLLGILWVGIQMQSYNELRSIASDVSRLAVVQYQKATTDKTVVQMTPNDIATLAASTAVSPPYNLSGDALDVSVTEVVSPMAGTRQFQIRLSYTPFIQFQALGLGSPTQVYNQNMFVPA